MSHARVLVRRLAVVGITLAAASSACSTKETTSAPEVSAPAKFTLVSGDNQTGNGVLLPMPLVVQVTDVLNRPVGGVTIAWATSDPTATLTSTSTSTDDQGQAKTSWTLGASAGRQTVTASTPSIPGAQVVFQATNGGVLTGGVTIQSTPPVAFTSLSRISTETGPMLAASSASHSIVPSASARQVATSGRPTRRLIVEFKPVATTLRAAASGAAFQPSMSVSMSMNMTAMRSALAPHLASRHVSRLELSPAILAARVTVPDSVSLDAATAVLRADPSVASVTEDRIMPMLEPYNVARVELQQATRSTATINAPLGGGMPGRLPNDPLLEPALWHYNLVDAPRAWVRNTGSKNVLVAVLDNGIRFDHPAMGTGAASNLTNDGYNFVTGGNRLSAPEPVCQGGTTTLPEKGPSSDPTAPDDLSFDPSGCWYRADLGNHGLHVAGTIGAVGNDGIGVTGINWAVSIRPVRVLDITGSGSYYDIAQGILYAAGLPAAKDTMGGTITAPTRAAVINMSLGGPSTSTILSNAVTAATNAGSLVIASAGNSETYRPSYPAAYPEVLAVAALGPDLQLSSYTNSGGNISLAAPGGSFRLSGSSGVASAVWNFNTSQPDYAYYAGTSMAAPHVTGVAALVLAASPGLSPTQLRDRLQQTAVHVGAPGRNDQFGYGIVNAYNAVTNSNGPARRVYVRVVNASTSATVQQVAAAADGSFAVSRLAPGSYYVYAGQDEDGDQQIGVAGRRFGWFGGAGGPTAIAIAAGQNATASVNIGTPIEAKPHSTTTDANRLSLNSYMIGQITATDGPALYAVRLPASQTFYFEVSGVLGSCAYGIELRPRLDLLDANFIQLGTSIAAGLPGGTLCAAVSSALTPGLYYLRVSGASTSSRGQYRVWVRDQP